MKTYLFFSVLLLIKEQTIAFSPAFKGRSLTGVKSLNPTNTYLNLLSTKEETEVVSKEVAKAKEIKTNGAAAMDDETCEVKEEEELSETQKLMQQVKDAGVAGGISYALWELGFWTLSIPVCLSAYYGLTGHLPDLSDQEDLKKLGGEAFAFVNFARFAVPLRIGLALSTTPWVQQNIVDRFMKKDEEECVPMVQDSES